MAIVGSTANVFDYAGMAIGCVVTGSPEYSVTYGPQTPNINPSASRLVPQSIAAIPVALVLAQAAAALTSGLSMIAACQLFYAAYCDLLRQGGS